MVGCQRTTQIEGTGGRTLKLTKPTHLTIKQGTTEPFKVSITRENFTDPIEVKFDNLPSGVSIVEKKTEIPANQNSAQFTFKADDNAAVVNDHDATLTVKGPGDLKSAEKFPISVTKK
jgi:hypothetical protein